MGALSGLLSGLISRWTMPNPQTTAMYTGGYNSGTNGMVDPGINQNQPVGPSMSPYQLNPDWAKWSAMNNGGQLIDQVAQANLQQGQQQQQYDLSNRNTLSGQNNVLPYQLQGLAPDMFSSAQSRLQSQIPQNQAAGLGALVSGNQSLGALPFAQNYGAVNMGDSISRFIAGMLQNKNSATTAQTMAPAIPGLVNSGNAAQLAENQANIAKANYGATSANQAQGVLQNSPYTQQSMWGPLQLNEAEIQRNQRQPITPGTDIANFNGPGGSLGSYTQSPLSRMNIPGMEGYQKQVGPPVTYDMQPKVVPNPFAQQQQTQAVPPTTDGIAPGGVGNFNLPQVGPQDIQNLLKYLKSNPPQQQGPKTPPNFNIRPYNRTSAITSTIR